MFDPPKYSVPCAFICWRRNVNRHFHFLHFWQKFVWIECRKSFFNFVAPSFQFCGEDWFGMTHYKCRNANICFFKYVPIPASFCLFSFFYTPIQVTIIQFELYKLKKQNGRRRRIHWAMAVPHANIVCSINKISHSQLDWSY